MQASQGKVSFPQLCRVTNYLGKGQRLPQPAFCFVSLPAGEGDFSLHPPTFNQVFSCIGPCGAV
jgi:hypothetical protein